MCGICGILNFRHDQPAERGVLEEMNRQIIHRGPDEAGFFLSGNIGMAMRRLSIIDVQSGHQPVTNEDDSISMVRSTITRNFASGWNNAAIGTAATAIRKRLSIFMKNTAKTA
jgi:asparagine synthase (glutamine-hydrolysing)